MTEILIQSLMQEYWGQEFCIIENESHISKGRKWSRWSILVFWIEGKRGQNMEICEESKRQDRLQSMGYNFVHDMEMNLLPNNSWYRNVYLRTNVRNPIFWRNISHSSFQITYSWLGKNEDWNTFRDKMYSSTLPPFRNKSHGISFTRYGKLLYNWYSRRIDAKFMGGNEISRSSSTLPRKLHAH